MLADVSSLIKDEEEMNPALLLGFDAVSMTCSERYHDNVLDLRSVNASACRLEHTRDRQEGGHILQNCWCLTPTTSPLTQTSGFCIIKHVFFGIDSSHSPSVKSYSMNVS